MYRATFIAIPIPGPRHRVSNFFPRAPRAKMLNPSFFCALRAGKHDSDLFSREKMIFLISPRALRAQKRACRAFARERCYDPLFRVLRAQKVACQRIFVFTLAHIRVHVGINTFAPSNECGRQRGFAHSHKQKRIIQ